MNTSLQSALDHIGEYFGPSPSRDDQFLMAKCMGMMRAYDTHWREDNSLYDVIAVEDTLIAPLINLRTQQLTSYLVGGKRDVLLREKRGGMPGPSSRTMNSTKSPTRFPDRTTSPFCLSWC